ncbi:hypothetical protein LSM04_006749 [Trypanosoma melophagium]|uniref:uncharacterized protein n=1 Tax=Trypanosoma melophagium TaxID=715481 RepID=UPI00351A0A3E|nr:hypothetical protein LSM04_006749 [Trypanosoma melophagium]
MNEEYLEAASFLAYAAARATHTRLTTQELQQVQSASMVMDRRLMQLRYASSYDGQKKERNGDAVEILYSLCNTSGGHLMGKTTQYKVLAPPPRLYIEKLQEENQHLYPSLLSDNIKLRSDTKPLISQGTETICEEEEEPCPSKLIFQPEKKWNAQDERVLPPLVPLHRDGREQQPNQKNTLEKEEEEEKKKKI